ncbi:hypothetical protein V0R37_17995 [Pollutimonas sp. H1-120]|uniref:hypothetical protein n=1 Tax=Pollutimonas sp. H1-120 TaxID=3148824 RepID=UPI003B519F6B
MVNSIFKFKVNLKGNTSLLISFIVSALVVGLFSISFEPRWETNDDIAMSMVAHGYGLAAYSSPNLFFSNILYGHMVRVIPEINGILGYSIATIGVLFAIAWSFAHCLNISRIGYLGTLAVLVLILCRPILFPQFTINAGLLMVSALICWNFYESQNNKIGPLIVGCLLALMSYLVRSEEAFLILAVGSPLLPWSSLRKFRSAKIAFVLLAAAIGIAAVVDRNAYQSPEWSDFLELNSARASFTDFGAADRLLQRPDILKKHEYSQNDIDLIKNWFFVDPNVANPDRLNAVLNELGPIPSQTYSMDQVRRGLTTLWHPTLLPIMVAALLLLVLHPSWRGCAVWILCIAAVMVLGLIGRPGILRVYIPLASLLLVTPLLCIRESLANTSLLLNRAGILVLIGAAALNTSTVIAESKSMQITGKQVRDNLVHFPQTPVVFWGSVFPFEAVYPVMADSSIPMRYQIYGLGVFTLAPFSISYYQQNKEIGMLSQLRSTQGASILIDKERQQLLDQYCLEHMQARLKQISERKYGTLSLKQLRCVPH